MEKKGRRREKEKTRNKAPPDGDDPITESVVSFILQWDRTHEADGGKWAGPYCYQTDLIADIVRRALQRTGGVITALYPRQSGKSEAVAMAFFYLIVLSAVGGTPWPVKIGIFAPSEQQALLLMRKVKAKLKRVEVELTRFGVRPIKDLETWTEYMNGTLIKAVTANKTASIVGESFNIMVLDESQDIDDDVKRDKIDPMGAHYDALKIYMGTPGYVPNFFYHAINDPKHKHFLTPLETATAENPLYARYVARQRDELGENSPAFRRQYALEWLFNIGQPITPRDIAALQERGIPEALGYTDHPVYIGLDLAKYDDSTVGVALAEIDGFPQVVAFLELHGIGYEAQLSEILQWLKSFPFVQSITTDATGAGDPVVEWFKAARPDLPIDPFKFSAPAKDALYKEYLRAIEDRRFGIPKAAPPIRPTVNASADSSEALKRFISENIALQREIKNGLLSIHHPPGGNDDYPDAAALAWWGFLKRPPRPTAAVMTINRPESFDISDHYSF